MSKIEIKDIDFGLCYEGYLWMSNENKPRVFSPAAVISRTPLETQNPFVVEGYLYNKEQGVSISIKSPNGRPCAHRFLVNAADFQSEDVTPVEYHAHRMDGNRLLFLRYWAAKPDGACLDMPVLTLDKMVFVGFKK